MTIKRKIQLNITILLICMGAIGIMFTSLSLMVRRAEGEIGKISLVVRETVQLYSLTEEYVITPTADIQGEWHKTQDVIQGILSDPILVTYQDYPAFQELKKNSNTIHALFVQMSQTPNDEPLRERLADQALRHARNFVNESSKLEQHIFSDREATRQQSSTIIFVLLALLFVLAVATALYATRIISKPITALTDAVRKIEGGDFSTSVPDRSDDEIGALGRAFNSMTFKVYAQTKALKEAKDKDDVLVETLNVRVSELEDSRRAMSNLFQDLEDERGALATAKAKDDAFLENLGDSMIAVDKDKKIIVINKAAENALGIKREDILGKKYYEVFANKDAEGNLVPEERRPIAQVLATGQKFTAPILATRTTSAISNTSVISSQIYYVNNGGIAFPVSTTVSPVVVNGEIIGAIDIFRDISKEEEMEKLRVDFLVLASHQLRTPLSGTKWLIETLRRGVAGDVSHRQKEYLDQIYKANERMISLVYDMLEVLRLESSAVTAKKQAMSISNLYDWLLPKMGVIAKRKKITLSSVLSKEDNNTVLADVEMTRLIMECYISNAIHYSPDGSEIVLGAKYEKDATVLYVKDRGIGIPKSEQDKIFERFYRAPNARQFIPEGTGLGLYRASLLAGKMGAKVSFDSEEGKGSTFYLRLSSQIG